MSPEMRFRIRRMKEKETFKGPTGTVVIKNSEIVKLRKLFYDVVNFSTNKKVNADIAR